MERCVGHCVCSLRSDSFSLDKCADCRVCTSAPFTTLCLSTYHLLRPSEQAGGQMGGRNGHCINKTTPNDMSYLAAASSTHCCGLKSSTSMTALLWLHPNRPLNTVSSSYITGNHCIIQIVFNNNVFWGKTGTLSLFSLPNARVIYISHASLRLISSQFSRKSNKGQQQLNQSQLAKVWTMTPQVFICMELLATGCNMLAHASWVCVCGASAENDK